MGKKSKNILLVIMSMKKQLLIIGIIALFVSVGLSGCAGNNLLPNSEISISELKLYPENYINKTIKIKGAYGEMVTVYNYTYIYSDSVYANGGRLTLDFSKITKPGVQTGNLYYFTGKFVKHQKLAYELFDYWLEVTNVESAS
jgi:hypothetical protein